MLGFGHLSTSPVFGGGPWVPDRNCSAQVCLTLPVAALLLQAGPRAHVCPASPPAPQLRLQPPTADSTTHGPPAQVSGRGHGLVSDPHFTAASSEVFKKSWEGCGFWGMPLGIMALVKAKEPDQWLWCGQCAMGKLLSDRSVRV